MSSSSATQAFLTEKERLLRKKGQEQRNRLGNQGQETKMGHNQGIFLIMQVIRGPGDIQPDGVQNRQGTVIAMSFPSPLFKTAMTSLFLPYCHVVLEAELILSITRL